MVQLHEGSLLLPDEAILSKQIEDASGDFICHIHDVTESEQLEQALRESQERLQMIVLHSPLVLFAIDTHGIFTLSEGLGLNTLGIIPGEAVGKSIFDRYSEHPELISAVHRALQGEYVPYNVRFNLPNNKIAVYEGHVSPLYDEKKQIHGVIGIAMDVSARVQAEQELQEREKRYRTLSDNASDLVLILDHMGIYRYASPSHKRILGYEPEQLVGTCIFDLMPSSGLVRAVNIFTKALQDGVLPRDMCRLRRTDGTYIHVEYNGLNCFDDPDINGFVINAFDVTQRVALERSLRYQALHDSLTDLPNRTLLIQCLEDAIQSVHDKPIQTPLILQQNQRNIALLTMDLDRFKEINDTFGHHMGDLLLQEVGARLSRIVVEPNTTVARLGGDEFAVLLPDTTEAYAHEVIAAVRTAFEEPFTISGFPVQVEVSIGAVLYPIHGEDALTLLRHADIAMYEAKREHEGYLLYDPSHDRYDTRRLALMGALRHAIYKNEFCLYYQPKIDLQTNTLHSVEALIRWQHPEFGFIPPDQFIPLAEQTGLITQLTLWVLETAVRQCREWMDGGLELSIAVNLSTWDLREEMLPDTIATILECHNVPSHLLRVELTESTMMTDIDRALSVLHRLAQQGVKVSVDDFGTGYSSLAYLKRLPISELKIDRSFVQHITEVETDATIVRSTVMMAHGLGLQVVAEGVENEEATRLLSDFKCDIAQGYYISRPVPPDKLIQWMRESGMRTA